VPTGGRPRAWPNAPSAFPRLWACRPNQRDPGGVRICGIPQMCARPRLPVASGVPGYLGLSPTCLWSVPQNGMHCASTSTRRSVSGKQMHSPRPPHSRPTRLGQPRTPSRPGPASWLTYRLGPRRGPSIPIDCRRAHRIVASSHRPRTGGLAMQQCKGSFFAGFISRRGDSL
jgi:hypothetical protein